MSLYDIFGIQDDSTSFSVDCDSDTDWDSRTPLGSGSTNRYVSDPRLLKSPSISVHSKVLHCFPLIFNINGQLLFLWPPLQKAHDAALGLELSKPALGLLLSKPRRAISLVDFKRFDVGRPLCDAPGAVGDTSAETSFGWICATEGL